MSNNCKRHGTLYTNVDYPCTCGGTASSTPVEDKQTESNKTDLLKENEQLKELLKELYVCLTLDSDMEEDFEPEIIKIKKALGWE